MIGAGDFTGSMPGLLYLTASTAATIAPRRLHGQMRLSQAPFGLRDGRPAYVYIIATLDPNPRQSFARERYGSAGSPHSTARFPPCTSYAPGAIAAS